MGINFNIFGTNEHRVFNYKPRFYDKDKEDRKEFFGHPEENEAKADADAKKDAAASEKKEYAPGTYLKGSFRDGNYQRTKPANKSHQIIGLVGLILFFIVLIYIAKFYSMLF